MYGVVTAVASPVESYDRLHAAFLERAGGSLEGFGLIVHVGRPSNGGYETFEVWESQDHYDKAMEMVASMARELGGEEAAPTEGMTAEVFEVHGLVVPRGGIAV